MKNYRLSIILTGVMLGLFALFLALVWWVVPIFSIFRPPGDVVQDITAAMRDYRPGQDLLPFRASLPVRLPPQDEATVAFFPAPPGEPPQQIGPPLEPDERALDWAWRGVESHAIVAHQLTLWSPLVEDGKVAGVLMVSLPPPPRGQHLHTLELRRNHFQIAACAAALCLLLGLWLSRLTLAPITQLAGVTHQLAEGRLAARAIPQGPKEVHDLALDFNVMAERLERSVADLTRQKELAEQSEALRREFLADISHSLGTPLMAIQGWIHAMQDRMIADGDYPKYFQKLAQETDFVSRSVKRLLELSRWETGEPELVWSEVPLVDPLFEVIDSLEDALVEQGIELKLEGLDGGLIVRGDRGRIRDLLQALLENVLAHAHASEIVITARPQGQGLELRLRDNGIGIPAASLPRVKLRNVSGRGGTGLGLAIAERLALAHGFPLQIESQENQGTSVVVRFDLARPLAPP